MMQGKTAMEIFSHALEKDKDPSLLAYMAWTLRNRRNKARVNEIQCPLNQILQLTRERRKEFQTAQPVFPKQLHRKHTRWKPADARISKSTMMEQFSKNKASWNQSGHSQLKRSTKLKRNSVGLPFAANTSANHSLTGGSFGSTKSN